MRFTVSESEGYWTMDSKVTGLTVIVTDSLVCHRVVGRFRSEEMATGSPLGTATSRARRFELARIRAQELADRLNEEWACR